MRMFNKSFYFWIRSFSLILLGYFYSPLAMSLPDFPADYDVGENSIQGGDPNEDLLIEITPYNAGEKLFSNDKFAIFERINFFDFSVDNYGDPKCIIQKPGTEHEIITSRVVVLLNIARNQNISRRMLWDEVRPALQQVVHNGICPKATGIVAHIYIKGWDISSQGVAYRAHEIEYPRAMLKADPNPIMNGNFNRRNRAAYDSIHALVSEGLLVAHFQFPIGLNHSCDKSGADCTFDKFFPYYNGENQPSELRKIIYQSTLDHTQASWANVEKRHKIWLDLYQSRANFDFYVQNINQQIARSAYVRKKAAEKQALTKAFSDVLDSATKLIVEDRWDLILQGIANSRSRMSGGPCDVRNYAPSCIEDVIHILY